MKAYHSKTRGNWHLVAKLGTRALCGNVKAVHGDRLADVAPAGAALCPVCYPDAADGGAPLAGAGPATGGPWLDEPAGALPRQQKLIVDGWLVYHEKSRPDGVPDRETGVTVRSCLDCHALVVGGPTRCGRCARAADLVAVLADGEAGASVPGGLVFEDMPPCPACGGRACKACGSGAGPDYDPDRDHVDWVDGLQRLVVHGASGLHLVVGPWLRRRHVTRPLAEALLAGVQALRRRWPVGHDNWADC